MEKEKSVCKHNDPKQIIKYGSQKGVKKYKCKLCGKYFLEKKRTGYTLKEKKFFSMLINFLRDSSEPKIKIQEAIANINSNIDIQEISKFQFYQIQSTPKYKRTKNDYSDTIRCYNPRLLICEDSKSIIMYRFSSRTTKDDDYRRILIIDSDENKDVIYRDFSDL